MAMFKPKDYSLQLHICYNKGATICSGVLLSAASVGWMHLVIEWCSIRGASSMLDAHAFQWCSCHSIRALLCARGMHPLLNGAVLRVFLNAWCISKGASHLLLNGALLKGAGV
jgi:hypothetical protein